MTKLVRKRSNCNKNPKIRTLLDKTGVTIWMAADNLGISESTALRHLRHELSEEEEQLWISAIKKAANDIKSQ